jgi:hypothetical protein
VARVKSVRFSKFISKWLIHAAPEQIFLIKFIRFVASKGYTFTAHGAIVALGEHPGTRESIDRGDEKLFARRLEMNHVHF